eukprot:7383936-Prymnesium_polylepis.3
MARAQVRMTQRLDSTRSDAQASSGPPNRRRFAVACVATVAAAAAVHALSRMSVPRGCCSCPEPHECASQPLPMP